MCGCCSLVVQKHPFTWRDARLNILDIKNIGAASYLLFNTQEILLVLTILMFLVFCLHETITNKVASIRYSRSLTF